MKNKIKGFGEIFRFSYIQGLKSKSAIISNIILCLIVLVSMPIMSLIEGDNNNSPKKSTTIKAVKIIDYSGIDFFSNIDILCREDIYGEGENPIYKDVEYSVAEIDYENLDENAELKDVYTFEENEKNTVYLEIAGDPSFGIVTTIIYSGDSKVKESDVEHYNNFVNNNLKKIITEKFGVTEDTKKLLDTPVVSNKKNILDEKENVEAEGDASTENEGAITSEDESLDNNQNENETVAAENESSSIEKISDTNKKSGDENAKKDNYGYQIIYGLLMVILFLLAFGGERIAMSIATEKSSKVMEYLMTSVKPMAIVVGKVLSSLAIIFTQVILIGCAAVISGIINSMINSEGRIIPVTLMNILKSDTLKSANPITIVLAIIFICAGFIFFALIAALAGAAVSKLEELAEGVKMYTFTLIIGAYIGIFILSSGVYEKTGSILMKIVELVPVTSLFLVPGELITGYVSVLFGIASLLVMLGSIVLLTKFVANVYESMIYYNGNTLKIKDIINISKEQKKSNKKVENETKENEEE